MRFIRNFAAAAGNHGAFWMFWGAELKCSKNSEQWREKTKMAGAGEWQTGSEQGREKAP